MDKTLSVKYEKKTSNINPQNILLSVGFKSTSRIFSKGDVPHIDLSLNELDCKNEAHQEIWWSSIPVVERYHSDQLCWSHNGEILFIAMLADENKTLNLEESTRQAYQKLSTLQKKLGYPYTLRAWNYFPNINHDEVLNPTLNLERYKAFCLGRESVLCPQQKNMYTLPAATAIGSMGTQLQIIFLATKTIGVQIENPRQISAFDYPKQYGPASPSFSRSILKHWKNYDHFYISGTASIIKHHSQHPTLIELQLQETLKNIEELIKQAHQRENLTIKTLSQLSALKVYIRYPELFEQVYQYINDYLNQNVPIVYLQGAICRKELLVEIEGCYLQE